MLSKKTIKIFGIIKLLLYRHLRGFDIKFDHSVTFHPLSSIRMIGKSRLILNQNTKIERGIVFAIDQGSLSIEAGVELRQNSYFEIGNNAQLQIGERAFIYRNAQIVCMKKITIGKHVAIGTGVSMFDHDHCYYADCTQNWGESKKGIIDVGNEVWIGANVVLLRNTKIGNNAVVGAGVIAKGEIEKNTIIFIRNGVYTTKEIQKRDSNVRSCGGAVD